MGSGFRIWGVALNSSHCQGSRNFGGLAFSFGVKGFRVWVDEGQRLAHTCLEAGIETGLGLGLCGPSEALQGLGLKP